MLGASSLLSIIKLFLSLQFNEESILSVIVLLGIYNLEYMDVLTLLYLRSFLSPGLDSDYILSYYGLFYDFNILVLVRLPTKKLRSREM